MNHGHAREGVGDWRMRNKDTIRGVVIETLPNLEFRIQAGDLVVRCYMSGRLRMNKIRLIIGDKVEFVLPPGSAIGRVQRRI